MPIEFSAPPVRLPKRNSHATLFAALASKHGEWVSVPLSELPGRKEKTKQGGVHNAATDRGLRVKTSIMDGLLYVRLRDMPVAS